MRINRILEFFPSDFLYLRIYDFWYFFLTFSDDSLMVLVKIIQISRSKIANWCRKCRNFPLISILVNQLNQTFCACLTLLSFPPTLFQTKKFAQALRKSSILFYLLALLYLQNISIGNWKSIKNLAINLATLGGRGGDGGLISQLTAIFTVDDWMIEIEVNLWTLRTKFLSKSPTFFLSKQNKETNKKQNKNKTNISSGPEFSVPVPAPEFPTFCTNFMSKMVNYFIQINQQ